MKDITAFRLRTYLACLLIGACPGPLLHGADKIVLNDDFLSVQPEPQNASLRSNISWYGFTSGGGRLPQAKQVEDASFVGSVLEFSSQSQQTLLVGVFPEVELKNAGDWIRLSLTYRYVYPPKGNPPALVLGLYSSGGAPLTTGDLRNNLLPSSAAGSTHVGYRLAKLPTSVDEDLQLDLVTGLGSNFPDVLLAKGGSGQELGSRTPHSLAMTVTLMPDGNVSIVHEVNGDRHQFVTTSRSQAPTTRFDEIYVCPAGRGFPLGQGNIYVQISNVRVTSGGR